MTTNKPPVVFKAEMFEYPCPTPNHTVTCEGAAHIANEILSQRLKPWYAVEVAKSGVNKPVWSILDHPCVTDTHIIYGLDPIEIPKPPVKVEFESIVGNRFIVPHEGNLEALFGKRVKVTVEQL